MSTQNISTAVIHVVGQYNDAGKTLVSAYRTGAHRLLGGAASRYSDFLGKRELPLVSEDIKTRLLGAQEKVTGFLANRLDIDTSRVVNLMDRVATGATSGIESIANVVARVEAPMGASVIETLNRVHQPIADVSVKIADKIAAGAKQIESRVAGTTTTAEVVKTVKAKAKTSTRRAVRVTTPKAD
ncbi:hypothetical protein QTI24_15290 [Variovorax sp. J22P240]|uniref:hypothetical protein n=1 Tax=unclassified Variovorax TaxID=663243 RepID=UPI00257822B2|nr:MULTISPECIES: hypothetical protein [unclassified Variovorax]MDL9999981.1 hypothetical protein [Variovorax sp. J22P240]MDM0051364.1 hypothetical protein [Variovorax sp. J22R115]